LGLTSCSRINFNFAFTFRRPSSRGSG